MGVLSKPKRSDDAVRFEDRPLGLMRIRLSLGPRMTEASGRHGEVVGGLRPSELKYGIESIHVHAPRRQLATAMHSYCVQLIH